MKVRSPATIFLKRAQLTFMLAALVPTALMTVIGIVLLATGRSHAVALVAGILVVIFCVTALVGYILGSIFVSRGANLASVQNEFLSSVSHELRTPLTSIRMFIDTLREDRLTDGEKQRCLTVVDQELVRLDSLVGKLIQLSKIESRDAAFERQPVRVKDLIDEALSAFEALDLGGAVDLRVDVAKDLVVRGDRGALAQAVSNLLSNAHKYTHPDDKCIEVKADADSKHVFITVADNGPGIPRPEQTGIFAKFERGSAAVRGGVAGTGLGLAIVRAIVQAHKGEITVDSEVDKGSRFRISLPRVRTETP